MSIRLPRLTNHCCSHARLITIGIKVLEKAVNLSLLPCSVAADVLAHLCFLCPISRLATRIVYTACGRASYRLASSPDSHAATRTTRQAQCKTRSGVAYACVSLVLCLITSPLHPPVFVRMEWLSMDSVRAVVYSYYLVYCFILILSSIVLLLSILFYYSIFKHIIHSSTDSYYCPLLSRSSVTQWAIPAEYIACAPSSISTITPFLISVPVPAIHAHAVRGKSYVRYLPAHRVAFGVCLDLHAG